MGMFQIFPSHCHVASNALNGNSYSYSHSRENSKSLQYLPGTAVQALLQLGKSPTAIEVESVLLSALGVWKENPKTSTAVLSNLAKERCAETSMKVLQVMKKQQLEINVFHYNSCMSACAKAGQWQDALKLLGEAVDDGTVPTDVTYNTAISAISKSGQWEQCLKLLGLMSEAKVRPNQISYSTAISACEVVGQWRVALDLLNLMIKVRISPDVITYSSAISACEKDGQWQLALELLSSLKVSSSSNAPPNEITLSAFISTCGKGGQWQLALTTLTSMPQLRLIPNKISFTAAIDACKSSLWRQSYWSKSYTQLGFAAVVLFLLLLLLLLLLL